MASSSVLVLSASLLLLMCPAISVAYSGLRPSFELDAGHDGGRMHGHQRRLSQIAVDVPFTNVAVPASGPVSVDAPGTNVNTGRSLLSIMRRLSQVLVTAPGTNVNVAAAPGTAPASAPVSSTSVDVNTPSGIAQVTAPGALVNVGRRMLRSASRSLLQVTVNAPGTTVDVAIPPSTSSASAPVSSTSVNVLTPSGIASIAAPGAVIDVGRKLLASTVAAARRLSQVTVAAPGTTVNVAAAPVPASAPVSSTSVNVGLPSDIASVTAPDAVVKVGRKLLATARRLSQVPVSVVAPFTDVQIGQLAAAPTGAPAPNASVVVNTPWSEVVVGGR